MPSMAFLIVASGTFTCSQAGQLSGGHGLLHLTGCGKGIHCLGFGSAHAAEDILLNGPGCRLLTGLGAAQAEEFDDASVPRFLQKLNGAVG